MKKGAGIERICANCEHSVNIRESQVCVCKENGVVSAVSTCRRFTPDLLKLEPRPRVIPNSDETVFVDI
ncbi:MAG: hypothetical protein IKX92_03065 [Clostridia bacterium]|nr:hypothetical protein [Clostridia bacterium]